jgi:putative ABC transport system permease protein
MRSRFYRLPWKADVRDEVSEEIAFHIEMRTRELIAAGMDAAAARREAERRFGDVERMRARLRTLGRRRDEHMQRTEYLSELAHDLTFTVRQLLKHRSFAAIAILTLALGIGGTTAIFSAVNAVVLRPLPLADPSRLFLVAESFQGSPGGVSAGNFVDAAAGVTAFEGLTAKQFSSFNLADAVTPERIIGARVTANLFDVMGVKPIVGRMFTTEEDQPGREQVVVLSHRLWMRRFGGSASIVGHDIRMNAQRYTVLGVMPATFDSVSDSEELWVPIAFTPERKAMHDEHYLTVYGRLKRGALLQQAQAELERVAARLRNDYPRDAAKLSYLTVPFGDQFLGDYGTRLWILLGAVGVVLLIACGNVANLLLARGAARSREIAIRGALGAGQWRIVRQLLTESLVLALIAAGAGLVFANFAIDAVLAWSPAGIPRLGETHVDVAALGCAVALALVSSVLCGVAPALRLARTDVQSGLRDGGRGATAGGARDRVRVGLIVAEVALSILLLFGAGLLIRSAVAMQHVDLGFDPNGVLSARVSLPEASYGTPARATDTYRRLAADIATIPGVSHAAISSYAGISLGSASNGLLPEGVPFDRANLIQSRLRIITPGYFETMRIPIVKGRNFDAGDRRGALKVMMVSAALAARAWPGQDPIGKRIGCCEPGPNNGQDYKVVVGVAGDMRSAGPATPPGPEFYLPLEQTPNDAWTWTQRTMYIVVRTEGDPSSLINPLRAVLHRVDPDVPLFDVRQMNQRVATILATAKFNTLLMSLLGVIGLLLAASGIYGVIAYFVSQRTQEIGVRMALGATPSSVIRLVVGHALKPVAAGTALGLISAYFATALIATQLFNVTRADPLTVAAVVATLIGVALVASVMPARRAAAVDPTRALQSE